MKVRIGNDIRLNLTLKGPRSFDQTNIKELKCFLINTSVLDYNPLAVACEKRFPGNCCGGCHGHGCCDLHHPISPIHMHSCGVPGYFVDPFKHHCHCGHLKYPYTPVNPAFGEAPLRPNYGHCCCCCEDGCHNHDHNNFCRHGHYDHRSRCFDGCCWDQKHYCDCYYRPGYCDFIAPHLDENFRYLADSKVLSGKNRIQTYFPARDQFMCGDYKLVVVVVVYEAGWGRCDLHTYTIDYGTVVTLVDDNSAIDGSITIDVDNDSLEGSGISTLNSQNMHLYITAGRTLNIGLKDNKNTEYKIYVGLENGGVIEFDPANWDEFDKIKFYSADNNICEVDATTGKLIAPCIVATKDVTITATANNTSTTFTVTVVGTGTNKIGFINSANISDAIALQNNTQYFTTISEIFGTHELTLEGTDKYLWIISTEPIADGNSSPNGVKVSLFDVPIINHGKIDGLYYYHCPNPLTSEGGENDKIVFDITIEPKN